MEPRIPSVLVAGDIVIDRHIYLGERVTLHDRPRYGTTGYAEPGGAVLTHKMIEALLNAEHDERLKRWRSSGRRGAEPQRGARSVLGCKKPSTSDPCLPWPDRLIGWASWAPFPKAGTKNLYWRCSTQFGYGTQSADDGRFLELAEDTLPRPDILVLDDAGDDFRHSKHEDLWHLSSRKAADPPDWILLKLAGPIGKGDLWHRLMSCEPRKRLIVLLSAGLLRQGSIRLSRGLSWERTAEHLCAGFAHNPILQPLRNARHVIVNLDGDGAMWIDFSDAREPRARLIFDAARAEGEWVGRRSGTVFGYQTCLTAAVALTLALHDGKSADPDFRPAIERGLSAMRNLWAEGHGLAVSDKGEDREYHEAHGFPAARLANEILNPSHRFSGADVLWRPAYGKNGHAQPWSILGASQHPETAAEPLYGYARHLLIRGESILDYVPHLRLGKLVTADRSEIEAFRSLRRILEAYRDTGSSKKPLCIGVFGSPGAGKSFGVEQLALAVFGDSGKDSYKGWKEFNLAQFDSPKDLIGAFHQVRDLVLEGLVPVVFWDEFDSQSYRWLQYLLAPMQDGRFQEEQITHNLGKCVFVFAGGTSKTHDTFGPVMPVRKSVQALREYKDALRHFELAKGPDFKSRLDGYLDVLGPDRRDAADVFFPVRRALLIRGNLGCDRGDRLDIDPGLVAALLEIRSYNFGVRSINKILEPLRVAHKAHRALRRSQLPAPNQMSIHVDTDAFHHLCARDLPFQADEVAAKLAPAIHESWRRIARREKRKPKYDMAFEELPLDVKKSNEAAARRIPEILALVGLKLVPGRATAKERQAALERIDWHIEMLGAEEHAGWMAFLELEGWRYAPVRDDDKRLHDCLRPYHKLDEIDREKDRGNVRHYPDFVQLAGYKIVPM